MKWPTRARLTSGAEEAPWVSFSDALAALVFVFMIVTAGFILRLAQAEAKARASTADLEEQARPYRTAEEKQRKIIRELAVTSDSCLKQRLRQGVTVDADEEAGRLSLFVPGAGWFDGGKATLVEGGGAGGDVIGPAIEELRGCLQDALATPSETFRIRVTFEGHTDGRRTDGQEFATNWELSAARGAALLRRFRCIDPQAPCSPPKLPRVEFVAAGYADSVVAPRVLCEGDGALSPRPGVVLSDTCDAAVCTWLSQHGHDQLPTDEAIAELSHSVESFLHGDACVGAPQEAAPLYARADEALTAWANAFVLCKADVSREDREDSACSRRWSNLRRVDVRIEVMPPKIVSEVSNG